VKSRNPICIVLALVGVWGCADEFKVPGYIPKPPDSLPLFIDRGDLGQPLTEGEIAEFTQTMAGFFETSDYFRWASWHSHGLADHNQWGQPGYRIWWTNTSAVKAGDTVTFTRTGWPDNTTAKVGRVLPAAISVYLASEDPVAGKLALDYVRGLSADYDGNIWGDEDPVVPGIMARVIFHRNHAYELEGGRKVAVDYESVRQEDEGRRHDTVHNPDNPTWGDVWVRNKRSKDDFPYLYRDVPLLHRLAWTARDKQMRDAAIKLAGQIKGMARDMVEHGYVIRTKDADGQPCIPYMEDGVTVDDFACFNSWDILFPDAECNPKLCTAYLAEGEALGNACGNGQKLEYESAAIANQYWASNMIWNYHLTAISLALAYGDLANWQRLLEGYADRMDSMMTDDRAGQYVEWNHDLAQLLVLGAAYGLPLKADEARLIISEFSKAAEFYGNFDKWDLWAPGVPDGEHEYIPDRFVYDGGTDPLDSYVRITEIIDLFEYCHSQTKDPQGTTFIDCGVLLESATAL